MTNDEAYYWDWGRDLKLSYLDHPPGVSWITWMARELSTSLGISRKWPALEARLLSPLLHLGATLSLLAYLRCFGLSSARRENSKWLLILTGLTSGLSLMGCVVLPDTGLLLVASLLLLYSGALARTTSVLGASRGALWGLIAGLCIDFKYHGLPIAAGLALGVIYLRAAAHKQRGYAHAFDLLWEERGFWTAAVMVMVISTSPVWLWNLKSGLASFKFQGAHGFAGLKFNALFLARALAGQMLLFSPLVIFATWAALAPASAAARSKADAAQQPPYWCLPLFALVPLALLIYGVSPFKQTLPHWLLPGYWLALPLVAESAATWARAGGWRSLAIKTHTAIFAGLTLLTPWLLAVPDARLALLSRLDQDPGPLAELSLWPELARTLVARGLWPERAEESSANQAACPAPAIVVAQRWFSGAQLAYNLPGRPRVMVLDHTRLAYYDERDQDWPATACPALVIAEEAHWQVDSFAGRLKLTGPRQRLQVTWHEKMPIWTAPALILPKAN